MLKKLKNLFVAPCCICVLFSCGKKVTDSTANSDNGGSQRVILPGDSGVKFLDADFIPSEQSAGSNSYKAKGNAWVRVPEMPKILAGDSLIVSTRIYFNVASDIAINSYQEFYCDYSSIKKIADPSNKINDNYNHYFKGCFQDVDQDGKIDELNYLPGDDTIGLQRDKYIAIEVKASDSESTLSVRSEIDLDYL